MFGYLIVRRGVADIDPCQLLAINNNTARLSLCSGDNFGVQIKEGGRQLVLETIEITNDEEESTDSARREAWNIADKRLDDISSLRKDVKRKHRDLERVDNPEERSNILHEIDEWTQLIRQHKDALNEKYRVNEFKLPVEIKTTITKTTRKLDQNVRYLFGELQLMWVCGMEQTDLGGWSCTKTQKSTKSVDVLTTYQKDTIKSFFDE